MTALQDTALDPAADRPARAPVAQPLGRTFITCVRREIWEHNSVYIAPLIAAGVLVFAMLAGMVETLIHRRQIAAAVAKHMMVQGGSISVHTGSGKVIHTGEIVHAGVAVSLAAVSVVVIATGLIVAAVYCLGALYNERRDRSILFWKSLPVSDATAVLAKAAVPLIVLPVVTLVVILATQLVVMGLSLVELSVAGIGSAGDWDVSAILQSPMVTLYVVGVVALWYAPLYAWLMLVSAWARRGPVLWAVLPYLALCLVEKIALGSAYLGGLLKYRLIGWKDEAMTLPAHVQSLIGLDQLDPFKFFSSPGLWLGLAFAGACLAGAIWLRRYREPI